MYRGKLREDKVQVIPSLENDGPGSSAVDSLLSIYRLECLLVVQIIKGGGEGAVFVTLMRSVRAVLSRGE